MPILASVPGRVTISASLAPLTSSKYGCQPSSNFSTNSSGRIEPNPGAGKLGLEEVGLVVGWWVCSGWLVVG